MLIKPLLIAALETAINRYLALDDNRHDLLYPLLGKIIAVNIQPFNETLYFCPNADNIQILDQITGQPDTTISGSAWALGLMGVSAKPMRSIFSGKVNIEGDSQTGKHFQALFDKLDVNLEGLLSKYMGAGVADRITGFFRSGREWSQETVESLRLDTAEFLQEETRDLPAKPEIDIFYRNVDELRTAVDRLESRIERIADTLTTKQE